MPTAATLFETEDYSYPSIDEDTKAKIVKLRHSIAQLEANLITPDTMLEANAKPHLESKSIDIKENKVNKTKEKGSVTVADSILQNSTVDYAGELNPSQLLAATTIEGKVLVIAGAGSGKTKTLTYRTSYLLESGVAPESILLLTFTRKAANEIKGRVKSLLAESLTESAPASNPHLSSLNLNSISSGTFHSFCNMLLRRYSGLLGINPKFTILDTGDSEDALDLICKENGYKGKPNPTQNSKQKKDTQQAFPRKKTLQNLISTSRNKRLLIQDLVESVYPDLAIHIPAIEQLAKAYHQYKRSNHLYDFDDIIAQVVYHLKHNLAFRKLIQDTFRHVMVDEYQDTNIPQKQLIDYICQPDSVSLMVVGDDNQSIYAFRGANYENILLFGDSYPNAKLIKLEQNYRSSPAILHYVNALSQQITLGYQKNLFSSLPSQGNKPTLSRRSNESEEAKYIADTIVAHKSELDYNDFAILSRTSFQSNHIQLEFMERNIPFIVVGGIKFIEKRHIKDVLALVKILYNPNDTIAWHRILTLFKGVGEVTATKITEAINRHDNSLQPLIEPAFNKNNEQLIALYHALNKASSTEPKHLSVADILDILIDFYQPILTTLEDNWRERSEDFRVLKNLAQEHNSLDRFLENLALDPPNDSVAVLDKPDQKDKDAVTLSTIHSAKGLEWPIVFVNALVDGMMPHHRSLTEFEDLEEERKLFYVACSRAKTHLYLTAPDYFSSFSGYFDKVSRFISEVPADSVCFETITAKNIARKQQKNNAFGRFNTNQNPKDPLEAELDADLDAIFDQSDDPEWW